jgi:hypothetical protein
MVAKSLDGLSTGLWNGAVMATYIYLIEDNSNKVSVPCSSSYEQRGEGFCDCIAA